MIQALSIEDARTLAFSLGIDHEMLPGENKAEFIRAIIQEMERNGRLESLLAELRALRPNENW